jgi:hypothetical protein
VRVHEARQHRSPQDLRPTAISFAAADYYL